VTSSREPVQHPFLGILLKLGSVLLLSAMVACVKVLGERIPPGQIVFFRAAIALLVVAMLAWRSDIGFARLKTDNWRAHAFRSLAGTFSMFCWFSAIAMIPLAEMTAISFTVPLFLTVLAMIFLGERIHWYRWTALGMGFAGVLIIVAPQLSDAHGGALGAAVALLSAVTAAFALMFLRRMSGREDALAITFWFFLTATVCSAATALFGDWRLPDDGQRLLLLATGVLGALGQVVMTYSYRYAEASLVAPLDYVNMLVAVAIGYYLFGEVPHVATWIGAPLIIAAGVIILWREYVKLEARRAERRALDASGGTGAAGDTSGRPPLSAPPP
jgi:drug/metabolite transporter (DMT)-like permease